MLQCLIGLLALSMVVCPAYAGNGFEGRPTTNNLFIPTGYTLHRGEFELGIGPMGFGISDNVQVYTNLILWAAQIYNAGLKFSFVDESGVAVAVGADIGKLELPFEDDDNDGEFTQMRYFSAITAPLSNNLNGHMGFRYADFSSDDGDIEDTEISPFSDGSSMFGGVEYAFSNRTKFMADVGYDMTFDGLRFGGGILFGWDTFRLKLGVSYFDVEDGFVFPNIGFRWRFQG